MLTPFRLIKEIHKLSDIDDWMYFDETIKLPTTRGEDINTIKELLSGRNIAYGYVLLSYNVDAMFVNVFDVNKQMIDIKPRSFRGFTLILRNEV